MSGGVNFISKNGVSQAFEDKTKFLQQTESTDLANTYSARTMNDRVKQQAGQANITDASGKVSQATIGENIEQEKIATRQGRSNLQSTDLSNDKKEVEGLLEMTEAYSTGNTALGDQIAQKYGMDPAHPNVKIMRDHATYAGAVNNAIKTAGGLNASPQKIQQRVRAAAEGYKTGLLDPTDPASAFGDIPGAPQADDQQIFKSRGGAGGGRMYAAEVKAKMLESVGYDPKTAAEIANGLRPVKPLDLEKLVEQQVRNDDPMGIMTPQQKDMRRAELRTRLQTEFEPDPAAAPVAPAGAPGTPGVPGPQSAAPPAAPAMTGATLAGRTQGPGGVGQGFMPNGGNAQALESGLQRAGSRLSEANPTVNQPPSASQAATAPTAPAAAPVPVASPQEAARHPKGTSVSMGGVTFVRVDSEEEAKLLPPRTPFITPDGRQFRR